MQTKPPKYLHLPPDAALPELAGLQRFKAVLIIESEASQMWQWDVSRWLVASGCRCLLAWGRECGSWAESVEDANLESFDYAEMPDEEAVATTWHEDEDLEEVFWFAKSRARHPVVELDETVLIHIGDAEKREEFESLYAGV